LLTSSSVFQSAQVWAGRYKMPAKQQAVNVGCNADRTPTELKVVKREAEN